jgi:hypothetical protein
VKEMIDVTTTGMAFLTGLGLPEILLWVLSFAVVFGILTKLQIFGRGRAAPALISIVMGFLVLLAVPLALISVIASMSTGFLVVAIGLFVLMAAIELAGIQHPVIKPDKDGKPTIAGYAHPFSAHTTIMLIVLLALGGVIFWMSGGAALIGIGMLPTISVGSWLLIIVGGAVLWMLSEKY